MKPCDLYLQWKTSTRNIGPTMEIATGLVIHSTIKHLSFLEARNRLQNNLFQKNFAPQSI